MSLLLIIWKNSYKCKFKCKHKYNIYAKCTLLFSYNSYLNRDAKYAIKPKQ